MSADGWERRQLARRSFLAGLAGLGGLGGLGGLVGGSELLAGCTSTGSATASRSALPSPGNSVAAPTPTPTGTSTGTLPGALPATTPWQPTASEISPAVKVRAVRLLEALGSWPAGGHGLAAARARLAALGYDPALAEQAPGLLGSSGAAAVQVVDAQYGGILSSSSSVLVVLEQFRVAQGSTTAVAGGTTVDVRLVASSPHWRVTALHPAAPSPASRTPGALATALLANPRLHLPVAARADIASGTISAGVLTALHGLVARHVVDVSVVKSGHPLYVFGTNRRSDHPRGHAVDVWAIDGHPVVAPANRPLVESVMRSGIALGAYQVGGPVDLDGGGSRYFSDNTHHDHIHLGFHT